MVRRCRIPVNFGRAKQRMDPPQRLRVELRAPEHRFGRDRLLLCVARLPTGSLGGVGNLDAGLCR